MKDETQQSIADIRSDIWTPPQQPGVFRVDDEDFSLASSICDSSLVQNPKDEVFGLSSVSFYRSYEHHKDIGEKRYYQTYLMTKSEKECLGSYYTREEPILRWPSETEEIMVVDVPEGRIEVTGDGKILPFHR